ncbi:hypothetical protein D3C73_1577970 [compost metagenome]
MSVPGRPDPDIAQQFRGKGLRKGLNGRNAALCRFLQYDRRSAGFKNEPLVHPGFTNDVRLRIFSGHAPHGDQPAVIFFSRESYDIFR